MIIPTLLLASAMVAAKDAKASPPHAVLVIHGGAGTILRTQMTPELEKNYRDELQAALLAGYAVLKSGGSSIDAVEAAIVPMENSPLFNAGKGAVFTHDGKNELDAAIMEGGERKAGAVAAITIIKNPIRAARAVMDHSPHVMLVGRGAELFATEQGLEVVDPSYFWTERRWKALQEELVKERQQHGELAPNPDRKFGTVGAVALDAAGNLAAGTSTGGTTNKRYGRVGDSPIIGAGTFADNRTCAVSATGHGEFFIRFNVAGDIAARMRYRHDSVEKAATDVIEELRQVGGDGGVIALDAKGHFTLPFNTEGMYRGWIGMDGVPHVAIYRDEH